MFYNMLAHPVGMATNFNLGGALQGAMGQIGEQLRSNADAVGRNRALMLRKYQMDQEDRQQDKLLAFQREMAKRRQQSDMLDSSMKMAQQMGGVGGSGGMSGIGGMGRMGSPLVRALYGG